MSERTANAEDRIDLCFASMNFMPFFGGAARRFLRYMPGLSERGISTTVYAVAGSTRDQRTASDLGIPEAAPGEILPRDEVEGFPIYRVGAGGAATGRRFSLYFRGLSELCLERQLRPDVVHILNLHWPALRWLRRIRSAGIPVVFSHTLLTRPSRQPLKSLLQRHTAHIPYRFVDVIVASTGIMRDALRAQGVKTRIEVIYNGVDLGRFHPPTAAGPSDGAAVRTRLGIDPEAKLVLAVGAVEPRKRVDLLLRGFAHYAAGEPRAHLVIAGPRQELNAHPGYLDRLDAIVREAGLGERVHFAGEVEDVDAHYRAADLFVLTTAREGMNNAIFEAMACQVPVLTVPFEGIEAAHGEPDVHHARSAATPEALGGAMAALLADPERLAALAARGRAWAVENMDVERILDRYAALYRELGAR